MEIWKDIEWYEWLYQVSNLWNVKSLPKKWSWWHNWKILKWKVERNGYNRICLRKKSNNVYYLIHRLVWFSFIYNPENKKCINHKNWIRNDNRVENLEWVTHKENNLYKFEVLWYKTSEKHRKQCWINNKLKSKKVNQYDLNGNFIKLWDSITEASKILWCSNISSVCRWIKRSAWWYKWEYKKD